MQGIEADVLDAVRYTTAPKGLPAADMNDTERDALTALAHLYIDRLPDDVAADERANLTAAFDTLHFAWAGGAEKRQPHYYRLQNDRFLVEYDNTQNDANHIHSVWRDPLNDYGADILAQHYATAH